MTTSTFANHQLIQGFFSTMADSLFSSGYLHDFLFQRLRDVGNTVRGMERDYLLNVSEEDLCQHLISNNQLDPPVLHIDRKEITEDRPIPIRMRNVWGDGFYEAEGHALTIAVPFDGDACLFKYVPSSSRISSRAMDVSISHNELLFRYQFAETEARDVEQNISHDLGLVAHNLQNVSRDVSAYNQQLETEARSVVAERKRTLLKQLNVVQSLNIPVRRRAGVSQTYAVPSVKRKSRIERPAVSSGPFNPEPILPLEEYENILTIAENMATMLERSPATFAKLKEEEIRDHFLVQLNAQYEGEATSETFNQSGKTDILIRHEGRNVFIAECKFWSGPKAFPGIVDQLLGYTSWRDTKTAIFLFNRNKDTTKVLEQIPDLVWGHPNFKRENPGRLDETRFRYMLHHQGDKNRELLLTVCLYDIPTT